MKNIKAWMMAAILLVSLCSTVAIQWIQAKESATRLTQLRVLSERSTLAERLIVEVERYRRASASFRKMGEGEAANAKERLRTEFVRNVELLKGLDASEEERGAAGRAMDQLTEFLLLSARIEPTLYSRDFYQRPEAREMHDSIVGALERVGKLAKARESQVTAGWDISVRRFHLWSLAVAAVIAIGSVILWTRYHFAWVRPTRKLRDLAARLQSGAGGLGLSEADGATGTLRGPHGEVEQVLRQLAQTARTQSLDRHRFVTAVASELRAPLVALQAGVSFIESNASDPTLQVERQAALDAVRKGASRLSRTLDDLSDLVDTEQSTLKLDEKIVDLRSLLRSTAEAAGGSDSSGVRVAIPPLPIWAHLDPSRFERVLVQLISKAMSYRTDATDIELSVERRITQSFRGIEILIQEGVRNGVKAATGPVQDLLRHWISESGFGLGLAQKIVQAHGGSISAAGTEGTGVRFAIRLPAERVAAGRLLKPSSMETLAFGG